MITYNISLNKELALLVDKHVKSGKFANRSEFFRQLLRSMFLPNAADNTLNDWIYSDPHYSELKKRVKSLKENKEQCVSAKEFDKEFNF
ncbi:ribbon-helix-helix domain-containing protein [Patescibacteria group bacterium]|nr:ribbon-helix-helix protein, CopG family [Candidatus Falkowbacteria bacterium]MBU3906310.1 ribbon-helix-helix domain-containing protein [Patescibacteria group bacterium]MCG2698438.1 ribbon-helix-helix domain-containing protein [Candidatus Parcubacteria bacterium]MBU4015356.1 ribbon-helix-helix domain-containing protein [Patescibacteria group bacterium]MBU4026915.1 ribbon-helix-helix domain-containing protein [Patescibacteria group bacterium]